MRGCGVGIAACFAAVRRRWMLFPLKSPCISRAAEEESPASPVRGGELNVFGQKQKRSRLAGSKELSAHGQRAVHERASAGVLPCEATGLEGGYPQRGQGDAAASPGRAPEPSRHWRPRFVGDG